MIGFFYRLQRWLLPLFAMEYPIIVAAVVKIMSDLSVFDLRFCSELFGWHLETCKAVSDFQTSLRNTQDEQKEKEKQGSSWLHKLIILLLTVCPLILQVRSSWRGQTKSSSGHRGWESLSSSQLLTIYCNLADEVPPPRGRRSHGYLLLLPVWTRPCLSVL